MQESWTRVKTVAKERISSRKSVPPIPNSATTPPTSSARTPPPVAAKANIQACKSGVTSSAARSNGVIPTIRAPNTPTESTRMMAAQDRSHGFLQEPLRIYQVETFAH